MMRMCRAVRSLTSGVMAMSSVSIDGQGTEITDLFLEFYRNNYADEIAQLAQRYPKDQRSLYIEAGDLYDHDPALLDDWRENPRDLQRYAEEALGLYDLPVDIDLSGVTVRLTDTESRLEQRAVTSIDPEPPRSDIGSYVALTGQLARITAASPRLDEGAFECQRCGTITRIPQGRTDVQEPHECGSCERQGPFRTNHEQSVYRKQRKIKLEEPIEERSQARGHSVPVYVEGDLCDYGPGESALPDHAGERATVLGIVRVDESQLSGRSASPETEFWIDARAIVYEADDEADIDIEAHREEFETLAARDDAVDLVAESLAPSLHAEEGDDLYTARRACAAWAFNAYRLDPEGAGSKRGDLHMCLIGDPGTGKSTLMGYLDDILPKSEFRTGTGLTEVGLTAAAVQEEFAGQSEWTLQPGILPRSDGGHCLIDEVDGVVDENTKAIHDALEGEQMVKADKAGIQADLPTRCALLAGGNPTYTRFDRYEPITDQIDLDPALFDRMDLPLALQDQIDEARDREKASHSLDAWDELMQAEQADRTDGADAPESEAIDPEVSPDVLRAWIAYARRNVFPTLTAAAKDRLQEFYVEVRDLNDSYGDENEAGDTAVPATMRTLEAGIRLSTAFARLRLADEITTADADRAIGLTKEAVGLRYDPESGEFDRQRTSRGEVKSAKDRRDRLAEIIEELEGDEPADEEAVIDAATEQLGADESTITHDLQKLKQRGELYEPQGHGNGYRRS